ncbi:MAG: AAA family ATPase [Bacteroidota bacterium]
MQDANTISPGPDRETAKKPYVGLRPFREDENHLFFGREKQIDELLARLRKSRFVAVLGASGSGKSSLVKAGLLTALHSGYMVSAGARWKVSVVRPGNAPTERLTEGLARLKAGRSSEEDVIAPEKMIRTVLHHSSRGLVDVARNVVLGEQENLLLVVDQFEELFRFPPRSPGNEEALEFVKLLINAGSQLKVPIYIIITMRSDFLGDCSRFPGLPEMINQGQYLVPNMSRENFRAVISSPAAVFYREISAPLETRLLNDIGDRLDQLPILQHALMRTWDRWMEDTGGKGAILLRHYLEVGGMARALDQHAEEIYAELSSAHLQKVCEDVFRVITTKGSDNRGVRRPTPFDQVCKITGADAESVRKVLHAFRTPGRTFVLPFVPTELADGVIVDISHETLMRVWARLVRWVNEEADSTAMYLRIREAMVLFQEGKGGLWRPPELHLATAWVAKEAPTEDWASQLGGDFSAAMDFVAQSDAAYSAELAANERERRAKLRRARRFAFVLAVASAIALGLTIFAVRAKGEADQQREIAVLREEQAVTALNEAEEARLTAVSAQKTAEDSTLSANRSRQRANEKARLADSLRLKANVQRRLAEVQRLMAVAAKDSADVARARANENADEAARQTEIAQEKEQQAISAKNQAERLRTLSIARSLAVKSANQKDDLQLKALIAYQAYKFHNEQDGDRYDPDQYHALYDARRALSGGEFNRLRKMSAGVRGIIVDPRNGTLITYAGDGQVKGGAMREPGNLWLSAGSSVRGAALIPNAKKLVVALEDGAIYVTDPRSSLPPPLVELEDRIHGMVYLAQPEAIVVAGNSGTIWSVDPVFGHVRSLGSAGGSVRNLLHDSRTQALIYCNANGEVGALTQNSTGPGQKLYQPANWRLEAFSIALSPDQQTIAIGTGKGDILLVPRTGGAATGILQGHTKMVNALAYSPSGKFLASASNDRTARLWNLDQPGSLPTILNDHESWVRSLTFLADESKLLTGAADGTVREFPLQFDELAQDFCGLLERNFTADEWSTYIPAIPYQSTCPK